MKNCNSVLHENEEKKEGQATDAAHLADIDGGGLTFWNGGFPASIMLMNLTKYFSE